MEFWYCVDCGLVFYTSEEPLACMSPGCNQTFKQVDPPMLDDFEEEQAQIAAGY